MQGMEGLIRQAFLHVDLLGPHVMEGHYDLIGPDGEIILPQVWDTMVKPDHAIEMQMWPIPELEKGKAAAGAGGAFPELDHLLKSFGAPGGGHKGHKGHKVKGKKGAAIVVPPAPTLAGLGVLPSPPTGPMGAIPPPPVGPIGAAGVGPSEAVMAALMGDRNKKKKKDEVPALARWVMGNSRKRRT